jgi:DNA replication and repair protein RecF
MFLHNLSLADFRNYAEKDFSFSEGLNLLVGSNASGKSNLLEAIYLLATGTSRRADLVDEMIRYDQELARIKGRIVQKTRNTRRVRESDNQTIGQSDLSESSEFSELEILLTRGLLLGEKVAKKKFFLNGVAKRQFDFVGLLKAVSFGPEDLGMITGGPSLRRDFLDLVLTQTTRDYGRALLSYQKGLRQRNQLLEQIREQNRSRTSLYFWDRLLIENGELLAARRAAFLDFINQNSSSLGNLSLIYQRNLVSPERLAKYLHAEIATGQTLVGPHRDDFAVATRNPLHEIRNLRLYGSRGEQRTAVFYLKLAELNFIQRQTGQTPVLLLDDIFSELDKAHRELILTSLPNLQVILTTTDLNLVDRQYQAIANVVAL